MASEPTTSALVIKAALDIIHEPGEVFEVRIPKTKAGTLSGYFTDTTEAALIISRQDKHTSVYATVNPVAPAVAARAEGKLQISYTTTSDAEILKRRWFLLDFDPVRPAGISSTKEELHAAKECAESVADWLSSIGWPEPLHACSGNGWHLMYRVDLPNDQDTRINIEFATKMLASIFSTSQVNIDVGVYNAARIWKVYGTTSRKGSHTDERPHRLSMITSVPKEWALVTPEQIDTVARPLRDAKSDEYRDMSGEYISDMVKWLSDRGQTVTSGPRPLFGNEGQKWTIAYCPFNKEHTDPVVGLVNNRPIFRCLHNSCSAFRWKEFREKIDPTYRDPETIEARLREWCLGEDPEPDRELVQAAATLARRVPEVLKRLRKDCPRPRVTVLEEALKNERKRYLRETRGSEHYEKGNIVGLTHRVREYQQAGELPMYWIADYDHRIRVGPVGDIDCPKMSEADEIALMAHFHRAGDIWVKQTHAAQTMKLLAEEYRVNPIRHWLKRLHWDGIPRLTNWLSTYMGTSDNEYTRAVGRKWLISAVARGMEPGIQADHMLIFEGKQGVGKSRAARILGGRFYTEYSASVSGVNAHRDMTAVISGKMIVEMSELATLRRADMESLKAVLTACADDVRLSYERDAKTYPRTCVFLGTTNEIHSPYIQDMTGARRFWPVQVGVRNKVNTERLKDEAEQLWAEAVAAFEGGEDWYTVPTVEVEKEQSDRQLTLEESDPWFGRIRASLTDPDSYTNEAYYIRDEYHEGAPTGNFIVRAAAPHIMLGMIIGIDTSRQTNNDTLRLRNILRLIGFKKTRPSKGWMGATYAYDLDRSSAPHLWSAIEGAKNASKFPKPNSKAVFDNRDRD